MYKSHNWAETQVDLFIIKLKLITWSYYLETDLAGNSKVAYLYSWSVKHVEYHSKQCLQIDTNKNPVFSLIISFHFFPELEEINHGNTTVYNIRNEFLYNSTMKDDAVHVLPVLNEQSH